MSTPESFNLSKNSELLPNTFKGDKFSVIFSGLPSVKNFNDFRYFQNYIKTVTIPEYNMNLINSFFEGTITRHPEAPRINIDLAQIQMTFRLSEDMKNYLLILDWMRQLKYGALENPSESFDQRTTDTLISKYTIKSIDLNLLDNHKRQIATISFLNCFATMVSSLNLEFGISDEVNFSVNFSYSEMVYKTTTIDG